MLAGKNRITLSKVSTTKTLGKLEDERLFHYKNTQKNFNSLKVLKMCLTSSATADAYMIIMMALYEV